MNKTKHAYETPPVVTGSQQVSRLNALLQHLRDAPDEYRQMLASAADENGDAFAVYLLYVDGVDLTSDALVEEFCNQYVGTYDSWQDAVGQLSELFGWDGALAELKDAAGEALDSLLTWDDAAVWKRLHAQLLIAHQDNGAIHVFS